MNQFALLRIAAVCELTGRKRSSQYNDIKNGLMTAPVRAGANTKAWPAHEVQAIIRARIAGKTDDELRALVARLHDERAVETAA